MALCLEVAFRLRAVLCRCTSKDIAFSCGDLSSLFFHLLFPCSTHFRGTLLRESELVSGVYAPTQSTQTCSAHCITSVFDSSVGAVLVPRYSYVNIRGVRSSGCVQFTQFTAGSGKAGCALAYTPKVHQSTLDEKSIKFQIDFLSIVGQAAPQFRVSEQFSGSSRPCKSEVLCPVDAQHEGP